MKKHLLGIQLLGALLLTGCSDSEETKTTAKATPTEGQLIWEANCAVCHQQGLGGAPMIGNKVQWKNRVTQGLPTLFDHALNGYSGNTGEMPARGGNEALTDAQVKLAVTYMVSQVSADK